MPGIRNLLLFLGKKSFRCEQTLLLCDPLVIGKLVKNSQLCWGLSVPQHNRDNLCGYAIWLANWSFLV